MQRREFLAATASAAALSTFLPTVADRAVAREPFFRSGSPRFQVGLAAYSLRNHFAFMKGKPNKAAPANATIDMVDFLDYCVAQNVDAAELTSYFFPPDADDDYFLNLKREAFVRGVTISGTAIGNDFTVGKGEKLDRQIVDAIRWIDHAATLGAPHIRFFAGTAAQLAKDPNRIDEACQAINVCAEHAARKGIFLGVENHGNLTADQVLAIMSRVDNEWVGVNLDTGNFFSDDPYGDLKRCVNFAVNVQVKMFMTSPGEAKSERVKTPADLTRIGKILKDAGYQGFVVLEYEESDPYEAIPAALDELRSALA